VGGMPPFGLGICWIIGWSPLTTYYVYLVHAGSYASHGYQVLHEVLPAFALSAATIPLLLLIAARRITERPTNESQPLLQRFLRGLDRLFERAERRVFGRQAGRELPLRAPVFWREIHRRSLVNPRHLTRLFVIPGTIMLCFAIVLPDIIYMIGLLVSMLLAVAIGVGVVASERTHQTLAVLLSTPLGAREVLRQKTAALMRLPLVAAAIVVACCLIAELVPGGRYHDGREAVDAWPFLAATAVVLPMLVFWLAVFMGLQLRGWVRPLSLTVLTAGLWLLGPLALGLLQLMPWDWCVASDPLSVLLVPGPGAAETSHFKAMAATTSLWPGLVAPAAACLGLRLLSLRSALRADGVGG
jgi:hypothetical protein